MCSWVQLENSSVVIYLPAGGIYADNSDLHIDGDISFRNNSAEGEPTHTNSCLVVPDPHCVINTQENNNEYMVNE